MHAYVFIGPRCWGFTRDETGGNLPAQEGPWSFFRNAAIAERAADRTDSEAIVVAGIAASGFSCLPIDR